MIKRILCLGGFAVIAIASCKNESSKYTSFSTPETGSRVASGAMLNAKLDFAADAKPDSVAYYIDSTRVGGKKDTAGLQIPTAGLKMGNHILSARIYQGTDTEEVTSNIIVVAPSAPKEFRFKVVNTYPHDISSYTEGLEFHDGFLYESTGQKGESKLLRINLTTGKAVQEVKLADQYFGEGLTIVGNKIIQLTWQEGVGFTYDKTSFRKLSEFPYVGRDGWGLCFDGTKIYNSCGSAVIYSMDKDTYKTTGSFEVYDHNGAVDQLNELEYIDGKIYANIYKTDGPYANKILIIDPATGILEATINLTGLYAEGQTGNSDFILNGIAWDKAGKRLFVTGKKWAKLFEIQPVDN